MEQVSDPKKDAMENFQALPEKPMDQVTIQQLEALIHETYSFQDKVEECERDLEERKKFLNDRKAKLLSIFQAFGKTSYRTSRGMIVRQKRFNVATPKDPAAKKSFFDFLKKKGVFEDLVSVRSQTLNAFYKAEMDIAIEKGEVDFTMPGIGEPKYSESLALRRK